MLLDALVVVVALTGAFAGVLALALYLVDRRVVRQTMREGMAFIQKAQAALNVPGADGKPLPPLQAAVSVGSSCLVNAAYALLSDPAIMEKAKPLLMEALPGIAEAYGRGAASAQCEPQASPGQQMAALRWGDRGGKLIKNAAKLPGIGGPMAKLQEWLPLVQAAKELGVLDKLLGGQAPAGGGPSAPMARGHSGSWPGGAL